MTLFASEGLSEEQILVAPLVKHIDDCFNEARLAKESIEERMLRNMYMYLCMYDPRKLAEIREIGGSEIFLPLVNIKSRALKAWLTDIFFGNPDPPFDIEPTPDPEIPQEMVESLELWYQGELEEIKKQAQQLYYLSQGQIDPKSLEFAFRRSIEQKKTELYERVREYSKEAAEKFKRHIDDQFVEGGFYKALDECLLDLALFPCAIIKSAVPRFVRRFNQNRQIEQRLIPTYNRVSPFDIYPSPSVPDFSDYIIEILHLTPHDLAALRDLPGYNTEEINLVLGLYADTGHRIDTTYYDERKRLEGKNSSEYTLIDIIEFWGTVKGNLLLESDINIPDFAIDEDDYYDVAVWVCDGHILRVSINPDPFGNKPYHKASFIEVPDSFWGFSLADVLYELQMGVNAVSRAIINNAALSSGPMVERNVDRVADVEDKVVIPWKVFDSTSMGLTNDPAYRFYQPSVTAPALIQVIAYYMKLADELSGIPSYAHGDVTGSGPAARTSTGLSMLMSNAQRGIKEVVKNIDAGLIEPVVRQTYYFNVINYFGSSSHLPDLNIRARGSAVLMEKMAQTQRMLELLNITNNPIDLQLVGLEGRRYLLDNVFRNFGVQLPNTTDIKEMIDSLQQQLQQQMQQQQQEALQARPDMRTMPQQMLSPVTEEAQRQRKENL